MIIHNTSRINLDTEANDDAKWNKDAKEFMVGVSYDERRGAQAYIPKPIAKHLGNPEAIPYSIKGRRIEVRAADG